MEFRIVNIKEVKLNPLNPRVIKDEKFEKLVKSIREFPEMLNIRPIVVDADMMCLGGNMRYKACLAAGMTEVPIIDASELSEEKQKEFIIKDNSSYGEWDWQMLADTFPSELLEDSGIEIPEFEMPIIAPTAEEDDFDPTPPPEPETVLGDLYEIGPHRLLCGDSTESETVNKLIGSDNPLLMVTDPPYGVKYDADWRNNALREDGSKIGGRAVGKVSNDDNADWTPSWALSPCKVAYVWHAGKFAGIVQKSLEDCDFEIISQIIWNKSNFAISRGDYHWKHEPCWYGWKEGAAHKWFSDRKQTTILEFKRPIRNEEHPTMKPVPLIGYQIKNSSREGDLVADGFLGSGTTMVASHQLKRKCYGMELDPRYCDVIIKRMIKLDPSLTITRNGINETQKWLDIIHQPSPSL